MRGRIIPEALRVEVVSAAEGSVGAERDPHVPPDLRPVPAMTYKLQFQTFQLGGLLHASVELLAYMLSRYFAREAVHSEPMVT